MKRILKHRKDGEAKETISHGPPFPSQSPTASLSTAFESCTGDCTLAHLGAAQADEESSSNPQILREEIESIAEVLRDLDLWGLPVCPAADTIRGFVWAIEYAIFHLDGGFPPGGEGRNRPETG